MRKKLELVSPTFDKNMRSLFDFGEVAHPYFAEYSIHASSFAKSDLFVHALILLQTINLSEQYRPLIYSRR